MKQRLRVFAMVAVLATIAALGFAPSAGAKSATTSDVFVVHGILGVPVDVYVDGNLLLSDFQPESIAGPLDLPAADYDIVITAVGDPLTEYINETVTVPADLSISLTAYADALGAPALGAFVNDVSDLASGEARLGAVHTANAGPVDVLVDGAIVDEDLTNGDPIFYADVPSDTYDVSVDLANGGGNVIPPTAVDLPANTVTNLFVISDLAGTEVSVIAMNLNGYRLIASDGGVFAFGMDEFLGSMGATPLNGPIVAGAPTPSGEGYWLVGSDGGVFSFGDAQFYGSTGNLVLNKPVIEIVATPTGEGYFLLAEDGGVFAFGDAQFYGSTGDRVLNQPVISGTSTPSGQGYWLVAADGGIFSFGDAMFYGSTGNLVLNKPVVGIVESNTGMGYFIVASDGGVFTFGDAVFEGSAVGEVDADVVAIATPPLDDGYWVTTTKGQVVGFGNAYEYGDLSKTVLNGPVLDIF